MDRRNIETTDTLSVDRTQPSQLLYRLYLITKRLMDILIASFSLLLLSPLLLVVSILIALDSTGPVLHRRLSLGKDGKTFVAYKFRTMVPNADEVLQNDPRLRRQFVRQFKLRNDPRVTRFGRVLRRTSIDEFPQLLNVVRGEMSLVGPRVIAPDEVERYGPLYKKMLTVQPGMSGLWVVSGRQDTSYEERVKLDMNYIDHQALWLDLKILLLTIPSVFIKREGAF